MIARPFNLNDLLANGLGVLLGFLSVRLVLVKSLKRDERRVVSGER